MLPGSPHPVVLLPIDANSGKPTVPSASEPLLHFACVTEPGKSSARERMMPACASSTPGYDREVHSHFDVLDRCAFTPCVHTCIQAASMAFCTARMFPTPSHIPHLCTGRKRGALYCPCIVARVMPLRVSVGEALVWRLVALSTAMTDASTAAAAAEARGSAALSAAGGNGNGNGNGGGAMHRHHGGNVGTATAGSSGSLPLQVGFRVLFRLHAAQAGT